MNRFTLLSLYRSLVRHKLYAALNIGGLAVGIAVFLILGLYVRFETSYEKWLPDHDKTYIVETVWTLPDSPANGAYPYTMGGLLDQMREDFPGVVGTRTLGGFGSGTVTANGRAVSEDVAMADPSVFTVLRFPLLKGDAATALAQPGNVAISETIARKYFGDSDPIGRTMIVGFTKTQPYRVSAVFRDPPKNTDFGISILIPLPRTPPSEYWYHWGSTNLQTYLRFDTPAAARAFEAKLPPFVDRRGKELADFGRKASEVQNLKLLPLADLHLEPEGQDSSGAKTTVVTLGLVGVLTLLIAVVNYINLATARAGLRAREVAMRKVLGADRSTLIRQFLGEAVLTVAIAALGGLILAELGLPLVNAAGGLSLTIPYGLVVPALVLLTVVVGVLAGVYPAILLSRFPAAAVLASARSPGRIEAEDSDVARGFKERVLRSKIPQRIYKHFWAGLSAVCSRSPSEVMGGFVAITFDTTEVATKGDMGSQLLSKIWLQPTRTAVYAYRPERIRTAASFEVRKAAILADYAAEQRANEAFQKDIVVGTETNCGTVIQVRGPMVEIAVSPVRPAPNGQSTFWSKRTVLTRPGPAFCTYGL